MHIISKKKIRDYSKDNAQAEFPLVEWYSTMQATNAKNLTELRKRFNSVDYTYGYTIFNIGGNNYRLITAIYYNTQRCYIRTIWTHAEYSKVYNQTRSCLKNSNFAFRQGRDTLSSAVYTEVNEQRKSVSDAASMQNSISETASKLKRGTL